MKCPKCGFENTPQSKFCCECGEKLVKPATHVCPKCGEELVEQTRFCPACGWQLTWVDAEYDHIPVPIEFADKAPAIEAKEELEESYAPVPEMKQEKKDGPTITIVGEEDLQQNGMNPTNGPVYGPVDSGAGMKKIFSIVVGALVITALVLLIIGCFGDIARYYTTIKDYDLGDTATKFTYIFKGYEEIDVLKDYSPMTYMFGLISLIFMDILFIGILITALISSILSVVKLIKGLTSGGKPFHGLSCLPMLFAVVYLALIAINFFNLEQAGDEMLYASYGWGGILMIVGIGLYILALGGYGVKQFLEKQNKTRLIASIIGVGTMAFLLVAILNAYNHPFGIMEDGMGLFLSPFGYLATLSLGELSDGNIGFIIMYCYLSIFVMVLLGLGFLFSLKGKDIPVIVLSFIGLLIYVASTVVVVNALPNELVNALSSSFILFVIFFALAFVSAIVFTVFNRKARKEEKEQEA